MWKVPKVERFLQNQIDQPGPPVWNCFREPPEEEEPKLWEEFGAVFCDAAGAPVFVPVLVLEEPVPGPVDTFPFPVVMDGTVPAVPGAVPIPEEDDPGAPVLPEEDVPGAPVLPDVVLPGALEELPGSTTVTFPAEPETPGVVVDVPGAVPVPGVEDTFVTLEPAVPALFGEL